MRNQETDSEKAVHSTPQAKQRKRGRVPEAAQETSATVSSPPSQIQAPVSVPPETKREGLSVGRLLAWFKRNRTVATPPSKTLADCSEEERMYRTTAYDKMRDHLLSLRQSSYNQFDQAILTLSSAILALSIGFIKDVVPLSRAVLLPILIWSWGLLAVSILSTLLSFIFSRISLNAHLVYIEEYFLNCKDEYQTKQHWTSRFTEILNLISIICFVTAIGFTIYFVSKNVIRERNNVNTKDATPNQTSGFGATPPLVPRVPQVLTNAPVSNQGNSQGATPPPVNQGGGSAAKFTPLMQKP